MNVNKLISLAAVAASAAMPLATLGAAWNGVSSGYTSDGGNWIGGTAPATGAGNTFTNTLGRTLFVTNDISYKLGDTTVVNGLWEFASTETLLSGNALLVGNANETVGIVNYADWTCAYYFAIGNNVGSTVVFTNRAGTIYLNGNGGDSTMPGMTVGGRYNQESSFTGANGTFVFESGNLVCAKSLEVGYGKNCTGMLIQTGGKVGKLGNNAVRSTLIPDFPG